MQVPTLTTLALGGLPGKEAGRGRGAASLHRG